ncbi:M20/M25/M40 family metallo-hydrolase [Clostridium polyendosporum]|uniref:M20/M25/M40 family metallo-hydrolase n=1 Tax=Clostridium polyendosporum TaxID=69208 RepID=UPI002484B8F1|nr:M20/M25/M40 family metallo-hydrolase [Clostridium polyendosporum]
MIREIEKAVETKVNIHSYGDAVKTKIDDIYVKNLSQYIANFTKLNAEIFGQHGSADTKFYSKYGIPAVEFGPIGGNWHGDDEYVVLDSVYMYKNILKNFILNV